MRSRSADKTSCTLMQPIVLLSYVIRLPWLMVAADERAWTENVQRIPRENIGGTDTLIDSRPLYYRIVALGSGTGKSQPRQLTTAWRGQTQQEKATVSRLPKQISSLAFRNCARSCWSHLPYLTPRKSPRIITNVVHQDICGFERS